MDVLPLIATAWASVLQGQLPPADVTKSLISKALGYGVMAGACITKVPQIRIILKNRSAQGLSFLSFEMEAVNLLIHTAYGYLRRLPLSTYGEVVALEVQTFIILALIYTYGKASTARIALVVACFAAFIGVVLSGHVTEQHIQAAFSVNTIIFMAARVPQIWTNFRSHSTGQLSLATSLINTLGCVVRIFTTLQEKAGSAMLRQYIVALTLNLTIVLQILAYKGKAPRKATGGKKHESKKKK